MSSTHSLISFRNADVHDFPNWPPTRTSTVCWDLSHQPIWRGLVNINPCSKHGANPRHVRQKIASASGERVCALNQRLSVDVTNEQAACNHVAAIAQHVCLYLDTHDYPRETSVLLLRMLAWAMDTQSDRNGVIGWKKARVLILVYTSRQIVSSVVWWISCLWWASLRWKAILWTLGSCRCYLPALCFSVSVLFHEFHKWNSRNSSL